MKTVVYDRKAEELSVGGDRRRMSDGGGAYLLHASDLVGMHPADLKAALKLAGDGEDFMVNITHDDRIDEDYSVAEPIRFELLDGQLVVTIIHAVDEWRDDEQEAASEYSSILSSYLKRNKASFIEAKQDQYCVAAPFLWEIQILCSPRGRDMAGLFRIGQGAEALLEAYRSGELTRETTLDLLRSGKASILIGQEEGPWLDVKGDHYDLKSPAGKISIVQAVARFANAEHGGIVVVGMRGKKVPGGEIIHSLCPVPTDGRMMRHYQSAIEQHLYPPPDYLDIETVPVEGGVLVVLHVPPQPEELKPFLVHGAVVDGKIEGAFISIVRRRGESSIPITAPAIHATLAAGRALLRRGELPKNP